MTAEIALLNSSAVALAADSAVTLSTGSSAKIYNTANKLFSLSKRHPVGVMIWGNANFSGIPIETLVKTCRQEFGDKAHDALSVYAEAFLDFLKKGKWNTELSEKSTVRNLVAESFDLVAADVRQKWGQACFNDGSMPAQTAVTAMLQGALGDEVKRLEGFDLAPGFSDEDGVNLVTNVHADVVKELGERQLRTWGLTDGENEVLMRVASLAIARAAWTSHRTGVAVAGFGEEELLPSLCSVEFEGFIGGRLKSTEIACHSISATRDGHTSLIVPFAQRDIVDSFLSGIDSTLNTFIRDGVTALLRTISDTAFQELAIQPGVPDGLEAALNAAVSGSLGTFFEKVDEFRWDRFTRPVLDVLAHLPKDELANLAEALISLTSVKRRVSTDQETVGGPVDVAVISKGDGFVWIKRKHYFPKELNPQFFSNYNKNQS